MNRRDQLCDIQSIRLKTNTPTVNIVLYSLGVDIGFITYFGATSDYQLWARNSLWDSLICASWLGAPYPWKNHSWWSCLVKNC